MQCVSGSLEKMFLRTEIPCIPQGNKNFGNLQVNVSKKPWFTKKTLHQLYMSNFKKVASNRISLGKQIKFITFLGLLDRRNSRPFYKLGPLPAVKPRACVSRFYALNVFMAAIFNWKCMVFDFYGAVHSTKKQGIGNFEAPRTSRNKFHDW